MKRPIIRFSAVAIFLTMSWCVGTVLNYETYQSNGEWGPFKHDQFCYYAYLPAFFIHGGDWDFRFADSVPENNPKQFNPVPSPITGKLINKVTIGMAIMFTPAFLVGHGMATYFPEFCDGGPTGYSQPYRVAMNVNTLLFILIALLLLRQILNRYFEDSITGFTLLASILGSNLFFYVVHENMMSHAYSFFLYTLVMWLTLKWHDTSKGKYILYLGALSGLIFLVRPTNIIILLLFILYGVHTVSDLKTKILRLWDQKTFVVIGALLGALVIFPQLLYWKTQAGQWFFYSYESYERFYWSAPALAEGLLGFCKGWYVYTPMMFLATLGLAGLRRYARDWFWGILVFFILNVYIVLSWWSWWYGGGFGLRAFAESGAVMSFGLAVFISWIFQQHKYLIPFLFQTVLFFIFLNLFQTMQYKKAYIRWNGMTQERYWKIFLRKNLSECERDPIFNLFEEPHR
jgi:hypothetical protein